MIVVLHSQLPTMQSAEVMGLIVYHDNSVIGQGTVAPAMFIVYSDSNYWYISSTLILFP